MSDTIKYILDEGQIPRTWYNIAADLPKPLPAVLHPGTHQPLGPDDLAPLFPMSLIMQEVSTEREIEIPDPVRDVYRNGGRRRCSAHAAWSRRCRRPRASTTSTKG
jgi:tryptophan synthase beta chain